jgi:putative ABC transport system permease protein
MNLLQLVFKQMRQRALSTWLTLLSVLLGVGLAVSIMILQREGAALFGQTDYGFDILIGAKGSPLQLVLNTVYHIDKAPGAIPYTLYEKIRDDARYQQYARIAIPFAVGDTFQGLPIMGTTTHFFGFDETGKPLDESKTLEYRPGRKYELAQGKVFGPDVFEAVIGAEVAQRAGLKVGDKFHATHGNPGAEEKPDIHEEQWTVVGILAPTHTASDRVLYIPLTSFYTIAEHEPAMVAHSAIRQGKDVNQAVKEFNQKATTTSSTSKPAPTGELLTDAAPAHDEHDEHEEKHYTVDPQGHIHLTLPKEDWELTGVMIKSRSGYAATMLLYIVNNGQEATAVNPASTMRDFFNVFLKPSTMLLQLIVGLVTVVAGVGILVSIYNSVSARLREIAILRALGATRTRVLTLICLEAATIGLIGGLLGLLSGHALIAILSIFTRRYLGESLNYLAVRPAEWIYLLAVVILAALAGLVPALKAYRTPVATNLVSA